MIKLFKKKKQIKKNDLIPTGVRYSVIPQNWPDGNKNPVWDSHLFKNKVYL